jgi:hypothetical protein
VGTLRRAARLGGTSGALARAPKDLVESGASLAVILAAGEWRSPAFMAYVDRANYEGEAILAAHLAESSDED